MGKQRILLTGGNGMVGKNLREHPGARDVEFLAPGSSELNLLDARAVSAYLEQHRPDMVIHAAGKVGGIQANMREPVSFLLDNLDMGRNIIWGACQAGVPRLLNLGSSCMYPRNHTTALREEDVMQGELEPTNEGYALAKITAARLCDYIMREHADLRYKTVIPCNLYGRHDKFDPAHSHLIPAIIHKIHDARQRKLASVEIWGDGTARREFMYAGDLADAMMRAITHFDDLPPLMNMGLGHDHSINEYYQAVADVMGYDGVFTHDLTRPVGMARKLVDVQKQVDWGWQAQHSLRSGIEKTYQFYLEDFAQ